MPERPRIAIGPGPLGADDGWALEAVSAGGGTPVDAATAERAGGDGVEALVWLDPRRVDDLRRALAALPGATWVQLPFAGVEPVADAGLLDPGREWTCAKGAYADVVAEHAVALALAGLRQLPDRVRATGWGEPGGTSLLGERVVVLGGGGITRSLLDLLAPWRVEATVVRRSAEPLAGAERTVGSDALPDVLGGALVVFVALALTPATRGIIGPAELAAMDERAWLVNVARGGHVDTDALLDALAGGSIAGAALDVTEPEPLPDGHPLWSAHNCIVTPHTADTWPMVRPRLAERITTNVARFAARRPLVGVVDPEAGY